MRFTSKLSLIFVTLASISFASADQTPAEAPQGSNSTSLHIPDDQPDFFFYGASKDATGHSMLANEEQISQAMKWGQKFYFDQLIDRPKEFIPSSAFDIPSISDYDKRENIGPGADFMLSCYTPEVFKLQHALNLKCSKNSDCDHSYFVTSIWGTVGKMNWEKDGILLRSCAILIVSGKGCNFPDGPTCKMSLYKDLTKKADAPSIEAKQIIQFGPVHSIDKVTKRLKNFAKKTQQQITLPDGSLTEDDPKNE